MALIESMNLITLIIFVSALFLLAIGCTLLAYASLYEDDDDNIQH
jgi:hypothetical protein